MSVNVSVIADISRYEKELRKEIQAKVKKRCKQIVSSAKPMAASLVDSSMRASSEYISLLQGKMRLEMGLENPDLQLDSIVRGVVSSIRVEEIGPSGDILGGVYIGMFREDFEDALQADGAEYISINAKGENKLIPWLSWMLFSGSDVVITGYKILKRSIKKGSRTGEAIMVGGNWDAAKKSNYNAKYGRTGDLTWRVPEEYSGTAQDNWITKVAQQIAPTIEAYLEDEGAKDL